MLLTIALLVGAVVFIIAYLIINYLGREEQAVRSRLYNLHTSNDGEMDDYWKGKLDKSLKDRLLDPVVNVFAVNLEKLAPKALYSSLEKGVEQSGDFQGRGMKGLILYMLGLSIGAIFLASLYISSKEVGAVKSLFLYMLALALGLGFPIIVMKLMIAERQEAIRLAMPDMLDLLCVSVEAGMGFDGAMGKVTAKMKGPLIDECVRYQQELRIGVTRRNALLRLSERCGIKEMQLFVAALIQAEKLGVGLAQVLEVQSENMREFRRQNARAMAAKLPTKILFPTLIFIFPVLFVVALGPPLATIIKTFAK